MSRKLAKAIEELRQKAETIDDPAVRELMTALDEARFVAGGTAVDGDILSVGNIAGSTGIAIGRQIEMTINQSSLPEDVVTGLREVLEALRAQMSGTASVFDRFRFLDLIEDKTEGFVGREYVFEAIEAFVASRPSGYFTIVADPGMGKSAILAQYVKSTGCIAHFNLRAQGINTARDFLESISAQLADRYQLEGVKLPPVASQYGAFLSQLLNDVSEKVVQGSQLVIAVDALDEVELSTQPSGPNILYLPPVLPHGVYFVLTSRPVDLPFVVQASQDEYDLRDHPEESRQDVQLYLRRSGEREGLASWIEGQGLSLDDFVVVLTGRSEKNFMYLRYVLPAIEQGVYENLSIESLPSGLVGYYEDHWARMGMTAKPLPRIKLKIVYILAEVKLPVSLLLLSQFAEEDALTVQEVLDEWKEFLNEQPYEDGTRYSVYHASFRDFLHRKDIVQAAGLTIRGIHEQISSSIYDELFDD